MDLDTLFAQLSPAARRLLGRADPPPVAAPAGVVAALLALPNPPVGERRAPREPAPPPWPLRWYAWWVPEGEEPQLVEFDDLPDLQQWIVDREGAEGVLLPFYGVPVGISGPTERPDEAPSRVLTLPGDQRCWLDNAALPIPAEVDPSDGYLGSLRYFLPQNVPPPPSESADTE